MFEKFRSLNEDTAALVVSLLGMGTVLVIAALAIVADSMFLFLAPLGVVLIGCAFAVYKYNHDE